MPNREKVIKGFECCHVMVHDLGPDKTSCGVCPYKDVQTEEQIDLGGIECIAVLHDDALALLKVQEEIIYCKDCYYYHKPEFGFTFGDCTYRDAWYPVAENEFCSLAKRKESR